MAQRAMGRRAMGRRRRDLVIAALLLALPLLVLQANLKSPSGHLNVLDRVILRVSAPLQAGATSCLRAIGGGWRHYVGLVGVERENEALRAENARLRQSLFAEQQSAARASEYERLLGIKRDLAGETVAAHAIAYETSGFYRMLRVRIDRGGGPITRGLPVTAADGLVGTIKATYGDYSEVLLAADPGSGIDVVLPRSGARAVMKGLGDARHGYLDSLRLSDDVALGDLVVTSGVRPFPKGLPVGRVVAVRRPPAGMSQEADVELAADPSKLGDVLILLPQAPVAPAR